MTEEKALITPYDTGLDLVHSIVPFKKETILPVHIITKDFTRENASLTNFVDRWMHGFYN